MTYKELYLKGKKILHDNNIESPTFDSMAIFQLIFDMDRTKLAINGMNIVDEKKASEFVLLIKKRADGYPLQYILGSWEFMDREYFVGEGVLVPREDTRTLVDFALNWVKTKDTKNLNIVDLCSGSGIIAITMAKELNITGVNAIELSQKAYSYLTKNNEKHNAQLNIVLGDVLKNDTYKNMKRFDVILSNPPYIIDDEVKTLSKEVQNEPEMALKGGKDGLDFYRLLIKNMKDKLNDNGLFAVECGINQAEIIKEMFVKNGYTNVGIVKDSNNIDRVVWAES